MSAKSLVGAQGPKSGTEVTRLSNKLEKGFTVLSLLLCTGGLLPVLLGVQGVSTLGTLKSNPVSQLIFLTVYVAAFALVAARWKRFLYVATRDKLLLLLVGLALVSVLWSVAPEVTARKGVALAGTTLIGIYFAMRYSLSEQLRLLAWALGIAALLSLLFALALPSYGIDSGEIDPAAAGAWKGIFDHKNSLGGTMTLSGLIFLFLGLSARAHRKFIWAGFGLSVGLIVLSESKSSLVIFLTLLILLPFYNLLRRRYTLVVSVSIIYILLIGSASIWILVNLGTTLATLGRDATLSGRLDLWEAVLEMIRRSPWLGYGYDAFWLGWEGPSATIWLATGYEHAYAHNGFLDLWLTLGLLGIVIFSLGFLRNSLRAIVYLLRSNRTVEGLWPLTFLTCYFLSSVTESRLININNIYWVLYVAVALSIFVPRGRR